MNKKINIKRDDKEYIVSALNKFSTYLYLLGYMFSAIILFSIVTVPEWVALLVMLGGGVLWTHLFWNKIVYSRYKKNDQENETRKNRELK